MKIVVYTALYGDKDELRNPFEFSKDDNIDYVCFTDNKKIKSSSYKIIITKKKFRDITKNARFFKINGFRGIEKYDISIWHDANIEIKHNKIIKLASYVKNSDFATFKHPLRNCVYEEGLACINRRKDYALRVLLQLYILYLNKFPNNSGLYETGVLVTNITNYRKKRLGIYWWKWVRFLSRRDQLSLGVSIRKTEADFEILPGNGENNEFSFFHKHQYDFYKDKSLYAFFNNRFIVLFAQKEIKKLIKLNNKKVNI